VPQQRLPEHIDGQLEKLFAELAAENYLRDLDAGTFS
jgi:hypothetical protein